MATEYINREEAIAKITQLINKSGQYTAYESGADDACYIVEHEVPTADVVEVVQGEWVEDDYGFIRCSVCGMEWDEPEHPKTNFCPNCGADMREVNANGKVAEVLAFSDENQIHGRS